MMNTFFYVWIAIFIAFMIRGFKKGFIKLAVKFISSIITILLLVTVKEWFFGNLFHMMIFEKENILPRIVVVVFSYIILYFALKWTMISLNLIAKLPILHGINKICGLLIGTIEALALLWILLYVVKLQNGFLFGQNIFEYFSNNSIILFLYEHNLISYLIDSFLNL